MTPSDIRIGFIPIARPTFDLELARELTGQVYAAITKAGYSIAGSTDLVMDGDAVAARIVELEDADIDMALVLQSTFADSAMVLNLARTLDTPLLLWALPEAQVGGRLRINSFCGINLAGHGLRRAGIAYDYIYAEPDEAGAHDKLRNFALAAGVKRRLHGARIGRLGEHPEGFDTCRVNHAGLRERLGVEVAQLELDAFFARARQADGQAVAALASELGATLAGFDAMEREPTEGTLGAYLALKDLTRAERLQGMAVRCWPEFFTDLGCSACGAMSLLTDALTPCSCEADVNGAITQLILQWLAGAPAFGSDIVAIDSQANESHALALWLGAAGHGRPRNAARSHYPFQPRQTAAHAIPFEARAGDRGAL